MKTATVGDLAGLMEEMAPSWTAESWDKVGLLVGDPGAPASRAWTALELSEDLLNQALDHQVNMLLLHHPPIFKPLDTLRTDRPRTKALIRAASSNLAIFAAHTNLDSAPGGVNDALADRLGLVETAPLTPGGQGGLSKVVVYVPAGHARQVLEAMFAAGAGKIGAYGQCSFQSPGQGSFLVPPDGRPFVGTPGQRETTDEMRVETVAPRTVLGAVVRAMLAAHPYEEPAFDLYPVSQGPAGVGLGRVGRLARPLDGAAFAAAAARELASAGPVLAGPVPEMVERVAVLGGSGGDMVGAAAGAGAQVLVTGEASHHACEQAQELGVCLLCLGHYETEVVVVRPWAANLARAIEAAGLSCDVRPWQADSSPWRAVEY